MDDARNKVVVDRVAAISAKDTDRNPRVPTRPTKGPAHTVSIDATAAAVGFKFRGRPSVDQVDDRRSFARVDDSAEGKIRKRGWKARHSRPPWAAATVTATALQPPPIPTTHRGRVRAPVPLPSALHCFVPCLTVLQTACEPFCQPTLPTNPANRACHSSPRRRTTCATLFMVRRALDVIVADDSDDDEGVDLMDKEEVGIRSGLVDTEIVSSFVLRV
uniref:Uncharacterized protein n=1 Tax=Vespula pensylvanica TaxID=30213 RepID=A0A834K647_VESPE|nr:hypothetical protein H0235_015603 [Vespula pensylvanica]